MAGGSGGSGAAAKSPGSSGRARSEAADGGASVRGAAPGGRSNDGESEGMSAAGTVPGDPAARSAAASDSRGLPPASTGATVVGMSIAGSGGGAASAVAAASSAGGRSGEENRDTRCGSGSDSADTGITVSGSSNDAGRSGYWSPAGPSRGSGSCPTGRARQRSAGEVSCAGRASSVGGSIPGSPSGFELRASGLGRLAPLSTALATVASPRSS